MADQITSVTGGDGGFSLNNFTDTVVTFNVPSGAFDVLFGDDYISTSSSADGLHTRSLSNIQAVFPNSPATINFISPSTGNQDPPYTATFTVSWSDPTPPDLSNFVTRTELNTLIDQWWETEVKPELEAINTTLELILAQHTTLTTNSTTLATDSTTLATNSTTLATDSTTLATNSTTLATNSTTLATNSTTLATNSTTLATNSTAVAAEIATIDTAIQRLRDLADHPNGPGIRTTTPYGYIGNAILYLLYITQAQILEDAPAGSNTQAEALARFNEIIDEMFANFDPNRGGFSE